MFDHQTAVHDYPEARFFSYLRCQRMDDTFLHPNTECANLNRFLHDGKDRLRAPKDVHKVNSNLFWDFEQRWKSGFSENLPAIWIHRHNAVTLILEIGRHLMAWS